MELKNKVLFVCMGNICRSPTAEGVFRSIIKKNNHSEKFDFKDTLFLILSEKLEKSLFKSLIKKS